MPSSRENKIVSAPPSFRDSQQREWTVKVNLGLLDSILERTKVDLLPDDNDPSQLTGLLFSRKRLGAVLWEVCREQAEQAGVDQKSFKEAIDGESLSNGWGALVDGILFFIQSQSPKLAEQFNELIEANMKVAEAGVAQIVKTFRSEQTDQAIRQAVEAIGQDLQQEMTAALAKSVGNSQESSASIRGRLRSAS